MAKDLERLIDEIYTATLSGDLETFEKYLHPEFSVHESDSLPFAGVFTGIEGFKQVFAVVFGIYDNVEVERKIVCTGKDHAMVLLDFNGSCKETGEAFCTPMIEMFRFVGDKLIEIKPFYFDPAALHRMAPSEP